MCTGPVLLATSRSAPCDQRAELAQVEPAGERHRRAASCAARAASISARSPPSPLNTTGTPAARARCARRLRRSARPASGATARSRRDGRRHSGRAGRGRRAARRRRSRDRALAADAKRRRSSAVRRPTLPTSASWRADLVAHAVADHVGLGHPVGEQPVRVLAAVREAQRDARQPAQQRGRQRALRAGGEDDRGIEAARGERVDQAALDRSRHRRAVRRGLGAA